MGVEFHAYSIFVYVSLNSSIRYISDRAAMHLNHRYSTPDTSARAIDSDEVGESLIL